MLFLCASGLERAKVFENEGGVGSESELAHSGGPVSVAPLGFKRAPRDGPQTSRLGRFFRGITRDLTNSQTTRAARLEWSVILASSPVILSGVK